MAPPTELTAVASAVFRIDVVAKVAWLLEAETRLTSRAAWAADVTIELEGVDVSNGVIQGNSPRFSVVFKDQNGAFVDPTTVTFKLESPAGVVSTYVYGTDAELQKDSVGHYHIDSAVNLPSDWFWRFSGTTAAASASDQGSIFVIPARPV